MAEPRPLQSPLLVGRDELLALAERRIADATAGRGTLLMFAGEAGVGKTRLLRATLRSARLAGFRVEGGSLAPSDRLVPLASILDLARSLSPEQFGSLGADILSTQGGKGADSLASRRILVREIADGIIEAIDSPTVLAFEDLQWADELSLEVIGELARHGGTRPLLLLATYRLDELPAGSIHREWRSRLITQRLAEEVRLERLGPAETALVTTLILGTGLPAPREVADAVYERTNGIPLHIEELLAALGDEILADARSIRDASVPDTIEDAVLARAQRLSEEARAVVRAGAVIGRCFAPEVLAGVMNRPVGELDRPLQELVDHSILYPFEFVDQGYYDFRHQLLRDALYQSVPTAELRRLHARAGEFGAKLVGANEVHASVHFERAGLRAQAFRAALAGARAAASMSSRRESFELFRRAIGNMPEDLAPAEQGTIHEEHWLAAFAVDDVRAIEDAARQARRSFEAAGDGLGAANALVALISVARRDVRPRSEREQLISQAESELQALPATPERAAVLADVRFQQAMLEIDAGRLAEGSAVLEDARRLLHEAGAQDIDVDYFAEVPRVLAGEVELGLHSMLDTARRAREARLESAGVTAYRTAAAVAIRVMEYELAETGIAEGLRYADEVEQSYCRHMMAATSAHVAWAAGRWDEAIRTAELELVDRGSQRGKLPARDALAFVALGRGMVDRARALLDESLALSRPSNEVELVLPALWGHAETALVAGEPTRALAHCEEALELARQTGERPLLVPFIVTGTRAAIADRRPDAAARWLEQVSAHVRDWPALAGHAVANAEGLIRLAAGSLVAARGALDSAVAGWDARGRIWESTWARIDLATCLMRSSRHVEAMRVIGEVSETAGRLGSPPLQARAKELLKLARGRGVEGEAWYPLTVREFEVARQIAAGRTNAEIATELFVSPRTVGAHVEHILAKLGASRRAEIATWVATVLQPVA
jgi:DNA-binding CsgD family transcriptional regulator